jgi:type II secretory pathway pseudopilin PulG
MNKTNQALTAFHRQRGITLTEVLVSLVVAGAATAGLAQLAGNYSDDARTQGISHHMNQISTAAAEYISDNHGAIKANATASRPVLIRVQDLITNNYLPAGYSVTNVNNQSVCVLVLEPAADKLEAIVVAEGGEALDDVSLGLAAATLGASGGGIYSTAATTLQGAMGSWSAPVGNFANANHPGRRCNGASGAVQFTAGHPVKALWFEQNTDATGFLYRDAVAGRPELNRMNTTLDMGGNLLAGLRQVSEGGTCNATTEGRALATNSTGQVLTCQSGSWQLQGSKYWRDPVANFAALGPCTATQQGMTRVARNGNETGGANRARAYTCSGGSWRPLSVDQNGNLSVPTNIVAGNDISANRDVNATRNLNAGSNATIGNDLHVRRNARVDGSEYIVGDSDVANQTVRGRATINELGGNLRVQTIAVENTACSPNGKIARTSTGLLLSCQSGSWKMATGGSQGGGFTGLIAPLKGQNLYCSKTIRPSAGYDQTIEGWINWAADGKYLLRVKLTLGNGHVPCDSGFIKQPLSNSVSCPLRYIQGYTEHASAYFSVYGLSAVSTFQDKNVTCEKSFR